MVEHKKSHRIQNETFCKMQKWYTNKTEEAERFASNASLLCYVFNHGRIIVSSMYTWCIRIYVTVWKKAQKRTDITSEQGTAHSMKGISLHCLNYSSINNANRCDYLLSCQSIGPDANTLILCERSKGRGRYQEYQMNSSMLDCSHWQCAGGGGGSTNTATASTLEIHLLLCRPSVLLTIIMLCHPSRQ